VTRRDVLAVATGVLAGVLFALGGVAVADLVSRPAPFPVRDAALPTPMVPATPTARAALPLVLQADGLGAVTFGDDGAPVVAELMDLLGRPNVEERWECVEPAADVRLYGWADLTVLLFDGDFRAYGSGLHYPPAYGPPLGLRTPEGLEIGATVDELESLYGDRLELGAPQPPASGEENAVREFHIDGESGLLGLVLDMGEGEQVIVIRAGTECLERPA
jgi:hypothetical protein